MILSLTSHHVRYPTTYDEVRTLMSVPGMVAVVAAAVVGGEILAA